MTVEKLRAALMASLKRKPKVAAPDIDWNTGQPYQTGPRAYVDPGVYVPFDMRAFAQVVQPHDVASIRGRILERIAIYQKDLDDFDAGLRARELDDYVSTHHPRIAAQFDRVATVKRAIKRK